MVRAEHEQVERLREVGDPADFYAPMARLFAQDPHRTDDPALEVLRALAAPDQVWLDIGAGGGRYALPLALVVKRVDVVEPSVAMREVLAAGMREHGITTIEMRTEHWPPDGPVPSADVALMAHIGYDIEEFAAFLDAAEAAASRCVVVMRAARPGQARAPWAEVHGEARAPYPELPELLALLLARGVLPEVTLVDRVSFGHETREALLEALRRQLWVRPGSAKDQRLVALVEERASERGGLWALDWTPMRDGVVSWTRAGA
jgi:hypothetical protein